MTTGKLLATAGILLALVSLSFIPAAAQSYTVTDLGTLGGPTSTALTINDRGQVAGFSDLADGSSQAFLWSPIGGMRDLGVINAGDSSLAYGVNASGEVVGRSYSAFSGNAFLWTKSEGIRDLGSLGGGFSIAYGINDTEQVVGQSTLADGITTHAFLWTQATGMQDLGTLGGSYSYAYGINNAGQVVGLSYLTDNHSWHAFMWTSGGGMQDLGTLGGTDSRAIAVNGPGQVLGVSDMASGSQGTFLWTQGHGMQLITNLNQFANAKALNTSTKLVGGWSSGAHGSAFLWSKAAGTQNLNGLIVPGQELVSDASGINRNAQIAGTNDKNHAVLLTPTK